MKTFFAALTFASVQAFEYEKLESLMNKTFADKPNGFSPINIEEDGKMVTKYVAAWWQSSDPSSYYTPANARGYIHNTPSLDKSNPDYYIPNVLGGSIEWDVDLSHHECGCIAAFYTVLMPGKH